MAGGYPVYPAHRPLQTVKGLHRLDSTTSIPNPPVAPRTHRPNPEVEINIPRVSVQITAGIDNLVITVSSFVGTIREIDEYPPIGMSCDRFVRNIEVNQAACPRLVVIDDVLLLLRIPRLSIAVLSCDENSRFQNAVAFFFAPYFLVVGPLSVLFTSM